MKSPLIITAIIVLLLSGCQTTSPQQEQEPIQPSENTKTDPSLSAPSEFVYADKAYTLPETVTTLLQSKGQALQNVLLNPKSPGEENTLYISSNTYKEGTGENTTLTNRIYAYNTSNDQLILYYEETAKRQLRIVGMDQEKLIIVAEPSNFTIPSPCFTYLATDEQKLSLNVKHPVTGLQPYTVPSDVTEKAKADMNTCVATKAVTVQETESE